MAGEKIRYICPICDHEMSFGKHFCWNCRSFIDEPWRYTGGHLPNEGHEGGCHPAQTYLKPRSAATQTRGTGSKSLAGKNNAGKQYTYNRPQNSSGTAPGRYDVSSGRYNASSGRTGSSNGAPAGSPYSNTPRRKNTGCGTLIFVLIVFWVIMQVFMASLGAFR